jgi:hypothetical protein
MNPFHTLADFVLAFRQAKTAVAAGRDGISISAFAEFEARLLERTRGLQARTKGQRWFDELRIGSVVACPREIKKREPDRPDDIVRVRPNAREKVSLTLRLQLEPTPEFSTVEVLYLWEFGGALEARMAGWTSMIGRSTSIGKLPLRCTATIPSVRRRGLC